MLITSYSEARILIRVFFSDRTTTITALVLGLSVLSLVVIYIATASIRDSRLAFLISHEIGLGRDGSISELVSYGLAFFAAVLCLLTYVETRVRLHLFLSLLMAFIWFDDSSRYHERVGESLANSLDLPAFAGLRPQDTGELIAWAMAGLVLLAVLIFSLLRRKRGDMGVLVLVSGCFGLLVAFGMFTDFVHIVVPPHFDLHMTVMEDGGEMIAVTLLAWVALGLSRNACGYYDLVAQSPDQTRIPLRIQH
jgi:hypothetical protein